jgi:hypothetical protein
VFAVSDWVRTLPAGVADVAVVTVPTVSPAVVMAVVAADCVEPTTFGTRAPNATTNATLLPLATFMPAAGLWLMMLPIATVGLFALVTAPTASPAPVIGLRDRLRSRRHWARHGDGVHRIDHRPPTWQCCRRIARHGMRPWLPLAPGSCSAEAALPVSRSRTCRRRT